MLQASSRLAVVVALLASCLLSFLTLRAYEQFATGMDWDYLVYVGGTAPQLSTSEFVSRMQGTADATGVTLVHLVVDRDNPGSGGTLYRSAGGGRGLEWEREGRYPAFSRGLDLRVRPLAELGDEARSGYWFVWGPPEGAGAVRAALDDLGLEPEVIPIDRWRELLERAAEVPVVSFATLMAFLVVALTVAGVFLKARSVAVLDLHGCSGTGVVVSDAIAAGRTLAVASAVYLPVAALALAWYDDLHWFGTFLLTQALFLVPFLLGAALVHVVALDLVRRTDVLRRLRGELRSRSAHALMYGARVAAVAIAVGCLAQLLAQERLVEAKVRDADVWSTTRGNVQLGVRGAETRQDQLVADRALGGWLDDEERAGRVVLVDRQRLDVLDPGGELGLSPATELLEVNSTYLRERPVADASGRPVEPSATSEVLALVPAGSPVSEGALVASVTELVDAELGLRQREDPATDATPRPVRVVRTAPGQRLFAYLNQVSWDQDPYARDPVVVVLPSTDPVFATGQWTAAMSTGQVILRDEEAALAGLAQADLLQYVSSVDDVDVTNAEQAQEVLLRARLYRLDLAAVLAATVATAFGFAVVHSRRHASAIFAQHVHGWSFLRRHGRMVTADAAVVLALAVWWTQRSQALAQDPFSGTVQPPPPLWTAWVLALPALALLWAGLGVAGRRLVERRAAD